MSRFDLERMVPAPDPDLVCCICQSVLDQPKVTPCQHVFCNVCIERWLGSRKTCPTCRAAVEQAQLKPVLPLLQNILNRLQIQCLNMSSGCKGTISLEQYVAHKDACPYEKMQCRYERCNKEVLRREKHLHEKTICPYREVRCKKRCGLMVAIRDLPSHDCYTALQARIRERDDEVQNLRQELDGLRNEFEQLQRELRDANRRVRVAHRYYAGYSDRDSDDGWDSDYTVDVEGDGPYSPSTPVGGAERQRNAEPQMWLSGRGTSSTATTGSSTGTSLALPSTSTATNSTVGELARTDPRPNSGRRDNFLDDLDQSWHSSEFSDNHDDWEGMPRSPTPTGGDLTPQYSPTSPNWAPRHAYSPYTPEALRLQSPRFTPRTPPAFSPTSPTLSNRGHPASPPRYIHHATPPASPTPSSQEGIIPFFPDYPNPYSPSLFRSSRSLNAALRYYERLAFGRGWDAGQDLQVLQWPEVVVVRRDASQQTEEAEEPRNNGRSPTPRPRDGHELLGGEDERTTVYSPSQSVHDISSPYSPRHHSHWSDDEVDGVGTPRSACIGEEDEHINVEEDVQEDVRHANTARNEDGEDGFTEENDSTDVEDSVDDAVHNSTQEDIDVEGDSSVEDIDVEGDMNPEDIDVETLDDSVASLHDNSDAGEADVHTAQSTPKRCDGDDTDLDYSEAESMCSDPHRRNIRNPGDNISTSPSGSHNTDRGNMSPDNENTRSESGRGNNNRISLSDASPSHHSEASTFDDDDAQCSLGEGWTDVDADTVSDSCSDRNEAESVASFSSHGSHSSTRDKSDAVSQEESASDNEELSQDGSSHMDDSDITLVNEPQDESDDEIDCQNAGSSGNQLHRDSSSDEYCKSQSQAVKNSESDSPLSPSNMYDRVGCAGLEHSDDESDVIESLGSRGYADSEEDRHSGYPLSCSSPLGSQHSPAASNYDDYMDSPQSPLNQYDRVGCAGLEDRDDNDSASNLSQETESDAVSETAPSVSCSASVDSSTRESTDLSESEEESRQNLLRQAFEAAYRVETSYTDLLQYLTELLRYDLQSYVKALINGLLAVGAPVINLSFYELSPARVNQTIQNLLATEAETMQQLRMYRQICLETEGDFESRLIQQLQDQRTFLDRMMEEFDLTISTHFNRIDFEVPAPRSCKRQADSRDLGDNNKRKKKKKSKK